MRRLVAFLRRFYAPRDGKSLRELAKERAREAAIPGYSNLHGAFTWFVPAAAFGLLVGEAVAHLAALFAVWLLWRLALPAFDSAMLARSLRPRAKRAGSGTAEATIANRVNRPAGVVYLVLGLAVVVGSVLVGGGFTLRAVGVAVTAFLAVELVVYVTGELLWSRHVGVGTRLRVYERRYDLVELVFDRDGDVADLDSLARLRLGERYERSYGWSNRRAASSPA